MRVRYDLAAYMFEQRQVFDVHRRDLVRRCAERLERINLGAREAAREADHAAVVTVPDDLLEPLGRHLVLPDGVFQGRRLARRGIARVPRILGRGDQGLAGPGLELDGMRARVLGGVYQAPAELHVAVMIGTDL